MYIYIYIEFPEEIKIKVKANLEHLRYFSMFTKIWHITMLRLYLISKHTDHFTHIRGEAPF